VSRCPNGIPHIIPSSLRSFILNNPRETSRKVCVTILTLLSIYRVINYKVIPNLDSIIEPGKGKDLDITKYLKPIFHNLLGKDYKFKIGKPELIGLESSGPNANKSA
jgi:hypothetical protein